MKFKGRFRNWSLITVALLVAFGIVACGGGGGSAGGGIGGTGKAVGTIDGFGSIFVNGVEFHTGSAAISIDDSAVAGTEGDLKLGMVVEIEGEFNGDGTTGTAFTVISDDVVEGPITAAVNTTEQSFSVMERKVFYSASTIFEDTGLLGGDRISAMALSIDNVVEVSGFVDSDGQIKATRVERKALTFTPGEILEVNGIVANLDTTTETFDIGFLAINYSAGSTSFDNGTIGNLVEGVPVEVKGTNDVVGDGFLLANSIEFEFEDFGNDGDLLQFEGVVTSVASTSAWDFEVNGLPVETNGQTQWRGGYTQLSDVTLNDRVEVDGTLEDQGGTLVLVAREVELEVEEEVRFEAPVGSIQASTNVLTILGIDITYSDNTDLTEFEDRDDTPSATSVDELAPGDWVRVRSYIDSDGNIVATKIEKENGDEELTRIILRGPAADVPASPGNFTILGVTIDISGMSDSDYRIEDSPSNETAFFNALTNGRIVKGRGSFSANTLTVEELDLQN